MKRSRLLEPHRAARCLVLVLSFVATSLGLAQEGPRPVLQDHRFVSTDLLPEPFVRTYVRSSVGYAEAASIEYPPTVVGGDTLLVLNGSLVYAILGFEYQQTLRDWLAVRIAAGLRSRIGTESGSLVHDGVTVASGYEFGWMARLRQTPGTMLSGSIKVSSQTLTIVDIRQFAEDVVNGVPGARLVDDVPMVRTTGGLHYAWAIHRLVGLTVLGEGSYGESPRRRNADSWEYGLGLSVDFDAGPAWNIPLGAALAYRRTSLPMMTTQNNGAVSQTVLRLAYNGKTDFLIALDLLGVLNRENAKAEAVWAGGAALSMRYYF